MASESVVKFSAKWCGPCRQLQPIWDRLKGKDDRKWIEFDVDEMSPEALKHWGVSGVPTIVLLDEGDNEIKRATGLGAVALIK